MLIRKKHIHFLKTIAKYMIKYTKTGDRKSIPLNEFYSRYPLTPDHQSIGAIKEKIKLVIFISIIWFV